MKLEHKHLLIRAEVDNCPAKDDLGYVLTWMNNLIKNEIKLYSGKDATNIYNLKINTKYLKEALTKDSAGLITDYKLSVTSIFTIDLKEKTQVIELKETINIKNQSDSFEQNTYEKNIKRSFASSIREKLISEIYNINDN